MKKIASLTLGLALLALPGTVQAQAAANASATASANVLKGLTLVKNADLSFGDLVVTGAQFTATVNATSGTGTNAGTGSTAAAFEATGNPGSAIDVSWTAPASLVHSTDALQTLTFQNEQVYSHTSNTQGSATVIANSGDSVTLEATTGKQFIWVGGEVIVGAAQVAGTYTGTFSLTVAY